MVLASNCCVVSGAVVPVLASVVLVTGTVLGLCVSSSVDVGMWVEGPAAVLSTSVGSGGLSVWETKACWVDWVSSTLVVIFQSVEGTVVRLGIVVFSMGSLGVSLVLGSSGFSPVLVLTGPVGPVVSLSW